MSNTFYWIALVVGLVALVMLFQYMSSPTKQAPLNASGYTYPSSPGA